MPPDSPLGPAPLTERPSGLLDLLGIQNGGQYPQHLASDWLLPQLDLLNFYLESQVQDLRTGNMVLNNIGLVTGTTVPSGEAWALRNLSFVTAADLGAATLFTGAFFQVRASLTASPIIQLGAAVSIVANGRLNLVYEPLTLFIAPPGAILGINVLQLTGASNLQGTMELRYTRMQL